MVGLVADRTIIVTGSKGGVGTTTVALNLSVQLASQAKKRVALLDFARPFGQISMMLDLEPRFTVLDALERIDRLDERILVSMVVITLFVPCIANVFIILKEHGAKTAAAMTAFIFPFAFFVGGILMRMLHLFGIEV